MRHLLFIFLPFYLFYGLAHANNKTKFQLGLASSTALKHWSEDPDGLSKDDLDPPLIKIGMAAHKNFNSLLSLQLNSDISHIDSKTHFLDLSGDIGLNLKIIKLLAGPELTLKLISNKSKFKDTAFDTAMIGIYLGADVLLPFIDLYARLHFRQAFDSTLKTSEDVSTKIGHSTDYVQRLGVKWKTSLLAIEGEVSHYSFGETTIVSNEFFYRIPSQSFSRSSIGFGLLMGEFELWGRFHQFSSPDDELSIYTQSASFTTDYTLAKKSLFLELIWNF